MPLTPNNREEHWLQGMVDGQTTLEPNKRREYWYKEIAAAIGSGGGGGGGGALVVHEDEEGTLDKTWQEIFDAIASGKIVFIPYVDGSNEATTIIVRSCIKSDDDCFIYVIDSADPLYSCAAPTDYPVYIGD